MELAYLYVMNYGEWVPVDYGRVEGDSLCFTSVGRDVIYRAGFYSGEKDYFTGKPFLLDTMGVIWYSNPDMDRSIIINAARINHGQESGVVPGQSYTLRYLNQSGQWEDHATKLCAGDGNLSFHNVPAGAFYFLYTPSDVRQLARIFLIGKEGEQMWY